MATLKPNRFRYDAFCNKKEPSKQQSLFIPNAECRKEYFMAACMCTQMMQVSWRGGGGSGVCVRAAQAGNGLGYNRIKWLRICTMIEDNKS